jgi:hypothetical protein
MVTSLTDAGANGWDGRRVGPDNFVKRASKPSNKITAASRFALLQSSYLMSVVQFPHSSPPPPSSLKTVRIS